VEQSVVKGQTTHWVCRYCITKT